MSESIQLHVALYVLMYMCNKSEGWGGLLSEEDFMSHILLKSYHHSIGMECFWYVLPTSTRRKLGS